MKLKFFIGGEMIYIDKTCRQFTEETASGAPVPGGGSVSAMAGALGAALGRMVASLTIGRKKYADVEEEMTRLAAEADGLREELMDLVQADIDIFRPLSELYGMKAETEEEKEKKAELMEKALNDACRVPLDIMERCGRAIELSKEFAEKGSRLAVSDAAASAILCKGAMQAASLNVYINTGSMRDRENAGRLNAYCEEIMKKYCAVADAVFEDVAEGMKG